MTTVADVLDAAADLIEERGWWSGNGGVYDPQNVCALQAIDVVNDVLDFALGDAAMVCLARRLPRIESSFLPFRVARWNDAPGQTQAVVVAKLREVAAAERAS